MSGHAKPKIVVLGGGFGGLEAALYLRMRMPEQADITLVSDRDYFLFKPNTIYIPFGLDPHRLTFRLARPTRRRNIALVEARARELDPVSRHVHLDSFGHSYSIAYDYLVVATGAGTRPEEIPGLRAFANTLWTPEEMLSLRATFQQLLAEAKDVGSEGHRDGYKGNRRRKVLFLVPPNNRHSGPIYEIAIMLDTWLRRKGARHNVEITFSTCEQSYVEAFGPRMHEVVDEEFERRGIEGHTGYAVEWVERNEVSYRNGARLPYDLLVSFPPHAASTRFSSLPVDSRGFICTDLASRSVCGYPQVYAVGDAADFPLKLASLACRQAAAAADHLSAQILGTAPRVDFEPVSTYVMEGLDRATFAQVPLDLTGRDDKPVEVSAGGAELYRVGSSPLWRLGKMAVGAYLPWRFKAGNPFHAGTPWKGMEASARLMSGLFAR